MIPRGTPLGRWFMIAALPLLAGACASRSDVDQLKSDVAQLRQQVQSAQQTANAAQQQAAAAQQQASSAGERADTLYNRNLRK